MASLYPQKKRSRLNEVSGLRSHLIGAISNWKSYKQRKYDNTAAKKGDMSDKVKASILSEIYNTITANMSSDDDFFTPEESDTSNYPSSSEDDEYASDDNDSSSSQMPRECNRLKYFKEYHDSCGRDPRHSSLPFSESSSSYSGSSSYDACSSSDTVSDPEVEEEEAEEEEEEEGAELRLYKRSKSEEGGSRKKNKAKNVVAFDCEMVSCKPTLEWLIKAPIKTGKRKRLPSEVSVAAHCVVVDYDYKILYNSYIRSTLKVNNWRGISEDDMEKAVPLDRAREKILRLFKDKLVVANDIRHDLASLQIHRGRDLQSQNIRDTSTCNILRKKANIPTEYPNAGLQDLAKGILHRKVQKKKPHDPIEDARVAMELYRAVETEWEEEIERQRKSLS